MAPAEQEPVKEVAQRTVLCIVPLGTVIEGLQAATAPTAPAPSVPSAIIW